MKKIIYLGNERKIFEYTSIEKLQKECRKHGIAICGNVTLGRKVTIGEGVTIGKAVMIGNNTVLGNNVNIGDSISIPDDSVIKDNVIGYIENNKVIFQLGRK